MYISINDDIVILIITVCITTMIMIMIIISSSSHTLLFGARQYADFRDPSRKAPQPDFGYLFRRLLHNTEHL